jgi:hypothetical protein
LAARGSLPLFLCFTAFLMAFLLAASLMERLAPTPRWPAYCAILKRLSDTLMSPMISPLPSTMTWTRGYSFMAHGPGAWVPYAVHMYSVSFTAVIHYPSSSP